MSRKQAPPKHLAATDPLAGSLLPRTVRTLCGKNVNRLFIARGNEAPNCWQCQRAHDAIAHGQRPPVDPLQEFLSRGRKAQAAVNQVIAEHEKKAGQP